MKTLTPETRRHRENPLQKGRALCLRASGVGRRGFTLIEVIVALVVISTAIAIIAQGFATGGGASVTAQNRTRAAFYAQQKMADLEAAVIALNVSANGTFEDDDQWTWEVKSDTTTTTGLYQMTVTIIWKERNEDRKFHLVRLMNERPVAE